MIAALLARRAAARGRAAAVTPTGVQGTAGLLRRRLIVAALKLATYGGMIGGAAVVLGAGGWSPVDLAMLLGVLIALPWSVLGFWNGLIGLWLLRRPEAEALARVAPFAAAGDGDAPIRVETAVVMTLRNEDPARAFSRLRAVAASVGATGQGERFTFVVLSDTSITEIAAGEAAEVARWQSGASRAGRLIYRRRAGNTGFKAGNLHDFCATHRQRFELMLLLDADSLMAGELIVRMVRIMQAHPRLGILQSLVVGLPACSAFARIFQFGMRHGMRAYTMGQAWWTGDCGPFWGHNALVRIAPYARFCRLPPLPGTSPLGGHILSHDGVEAVLMRRAGYEVRVLPEEGGSWEENPPDVRAFIARDRRWCQGNMQYLRLLGLPGLRPVSRFQLVWAVLMFIGIPASIGLLALLPLKLLDGEDHAAFPAGLAIGLYLALLVMHVAPKLCGLLDTALRAGGIRRYGGGPRFAAGAVIELVFWFLLGAIGMLHTTVFMAKLPFGRTEAWNGQSRDARALSWRTALRSFWPQLVFGTYVIATLALLSPAVLAWAMPLLAGFVLAVPFAVLTAHPAAGEVLRRTRLCGVPEEFADLAKPWAVHQPLTADTSLTLQAAPVAAAAPP